MITDDGKAFPYDVVPFSQGKLTFPCDFVSSPYGDGVFPYEVIVIAYKDILIFRDAATILRGIEMLSYGCALLRSRKTKMQNRKDAKTQRSAEIMI